VCIPLIPGALAQLCGPVPNVLAIHLFQRLGKVQAVHEAHEAKPLRLLRPLVLDNLGAGMNQHRHARCGDAEEHACLVCSYQVVIKQTYNSRLAQFNGACLTHLAC